MADTNEESGEQSGAVDSLVNRGVRAGANNRRKRALISRSANIQRKISGGLRKAGGNPAIFVTSSETVYAAPLHPAAW